jgi:hypothetical protein
MNVSCGIDKRAGAFSLLSILIWLTEAIKVCCWRQTLTINFTADNFSPDRLQGMLEHRNGVQTRKTTIEKVTANVLAFAFCFIGKVSWHGEETKTEKEKTF